MFLLQKKTRQTKTKLVLSPFTTNVFDIFRSHRWGNKLCFNVVLSQYRFSIMFNRQTKKHKYSLINNLVFIDKEAKKYDDKS